MDLQVEWQSPIPLRDGTRQGLIYLCDLERLPKRPGVYVFGRRFGKNFEVLYVGKAHSISDRVRSQIRNNVKLMMHVRNARHGPRILVAGCFRAAPGQQEQRCLPLIERALIRHFLSEAHDLVNKQGTRLQQHSIVSIRAKRLVPKKMLLNRG